MSILSDIKKGVEQSGSNKGKLLYIKADSKLRVRFLQEIEDGVKVKIHDSFEKGVTVICQELLGEDCHYCDDDELRHRDAYVYSVWDYEASEIKLFIGYPNAYNPLPSLVAMYESYGTMMDRDYVIQKDGKGMNSRVSVIPMDKVKFKNKKAKAYSEKKMLEILNKAYPTGESESESGKSKKKGKKKGRDIEEDDIEFEEDDSNEDEYEAMSPRELYAECIDRDIEGVKKKQKKKYYIDLLLEDDESDNDEDDEDEDDWDDEEEDDDDDW